MSSQNFKNSENLVNNIYISQKKKIIKKNKLKIKFDKNIEIKKFSFSFDKTENIF